MTRAILTGIAPARPSVLHVIGSMELRLGGASRGLRDLLPLLDRCGTRNEVLCLDDPEASDVGECVLTIHRIGRPRNPWNYSASLMPWLMRHGEAFDAVVVHGLWLHHGMAVSRWVRSLRASRHAHAPTLMVMPHGMLDPWFQEAPDRRWKALRNALYWRMVERSVVASADAVLFTSEEERLRAHSTFPRYPEVRERVVGFGAAPPPAIRTTGLVYPYTELPLAGGEPYLLYLGRIHEKKGVDLLLDAYSSLRSAGLPALLLAGPGWDTAYGRTIRKSMGRDEFLRRKVHVDGMLTGVRKWQALRGCEALLLPSHQENFGVVVAEALACGRPVLLSDKVNIHREVLEAGAGLCGPDTAEGVVSLLTRWVSMGPAERSAMSAAAMDAFEDRFRMESCARRFQSLLRELVPAHAGGSTLSFDRVRR